jgi:hypothetical protein
MAVANLLRTLDTGAGSVVQVKHSYAQPETSLPLRGTNHRRPEAKN